MGSRGVPDLKSSKIGHCEINNGEMIHSAMIDSEIKNDKIINFINSNYKRNWFYRLQVKTAKTCKSLMMRSSICFKATLKMYCSHQWLIVIDF